MQYVNLPIRWWDVDPPTITEVTTNRTVAVDVAIWIYNALNPLAQIGI